MGGEERDDDSTMDDVLPPRSLLTSGLDTWEEPLAALIADDMDRLKERHLRPSAAWREGASLTAGPKSVARLIQKKIRARARKEQGRRTWVSGHDFKSRAQEGPGRIQGKQPAFHSL